MQRGRRLLSEREVAGIDTATTQGHMGERAMSRPLPYLLEPRPLRPDLAPTSVYERWA